MHNKDNLIGKTILKNNLKESIQITGKQQYLTGYLRREKLIKNTPHTPPPPPPQNFPFNALLPHQDLATS